MGNEHHALHLRRVTHKLRQNDPNFVKIFLPLEDDSDLTELIRAVRSNNTVKEVSIFSEFLEDDWMEFPDVWRLFRAVGALPKLERLAFDNIGSDGDELPISLLNSIASPAQHLLSLELSCVHLTGTEESFAIFAQSLRQKAALKKFHIYGCYLSEDLRGTGTRLDPIVEEIGSLPALEDVQIAALDFGSLGRISAQSLGTLLHLSASLRNLVLGEFALDDEHIVGISGALEHNQALKELSFGCELGAPGAQALANMLRSNQTLEILHLHLAKLEGGEGHHIFIAQALQANHSLKRFSLYGTSGNISSNTQNAYLGMLKQNYTLEELEFQDEDESIQPQIDMYLKLNEAGRGRLLQSNNSTRADWNNAIVELHDDLDCVFHLISLNPTVIQSEVPTPARGQKRKR